MRRLVWFGHFCFIGTVVFAFLLLYGLARLGTLFVPGRERRRRLVGRLRGKLLRRAMTILGATFIKLGQVLSTRPDLLGPEVIDELRHLQDRLPPFSFARVRRAIEADLGGKVEDHFAELDEAPVAAASVAQVHRGRLRDGTEVAVKVLRPGVRSLVERDARVLLSGARLIALHPTWRLSDPVGHTEHFVAGIIEQTDLEHEAKNYETFRANFEGVEGVHFPRTYPEHSGPTVMTMEFMRGTKVDALPSGDHVRIAERIKHAIFKMCFEDGFVHADLHPGNMVVTEEGDLCIFDVGLAKHLAGDIFEQFIDFSRCIAMGTAHDFILHMKRFHTYVKDVDWEALEADVGDFVERFRAMDVAQLELGQFFNEIFALGRKYKVRPLTDVMLVIVGVVTAEGIGKQLNPDINLFSEMAAFLGPVMARRAAALSG